MPEGEENISYQNPPKPEPHGEDFGVGEKKEFLKREEIRTMERDLSKLRETEAEKERERISSLGPGEKISEPEEKKTEEIKKEIEEAPGVLIPRRFRKPTSTQKTLIRTIAVLLLFLTIGFFYWLLTEKIPGEPVEEETETPIEEETNVPEESEIIEETPLEEATTTPEEETITPEEETTEPEEEITKPEIVDNILTWGYYIPGTPRTIDTIIIHSAYNATGEDVHSVEGVLEEFKLYKVTSHFLIARDGTIYQLAPEEAVAYHAGRGQMPDGSRKDKINNYSLGIESIYSETESPNDIQIEKLVALVSYLMDKYGISTENILEHEDISLSGKDDMWNFEREELINLLNNN